MYYPCGGKAELCCRKEEDFGTLCWSQDTSSISAEVLIEQRYHGLGKRYELEVMRDNIGKHDRDLSIENFDPMGVHTGDSIQLLQR